MASILRSPNLADRDEPVVVRLFQAHRSAFRNGGLAQVAEHVRAAGREGDDILLHINPQEYEFLKSQWGEPSVNPSTGLPEYGFWSKVKKALKFEAFNTKKIVKGILKNPERLLTGAVDPLGTKIANEMYGTEWDPLVNQLGGATEQTFADAEAQGLDTGLARDLHKTAGLVAGVWGGNALGNLASTGMGNLASGLESYAAANTLTPAMTSVAKTGDIALSTQLPQIGAVTSTASAGANALGTAANIGADAARYGEGALANLGPKALEAAKDPKNWGTLAKGIGALGALGGAGAEEAPVAPSTLPDSTGTLRDLAFTRSRNAQERDWYTYGEAGPEATFYDYNNLPDMVPTPQPVKGARHGGEMRSDRPPFMPPAFRSEFDTDLSDTRHVRGAGSGRSDDIEARLSDGEYVLTAEDVALLGDGSSEAGARRLDEMRETLRKHKGRALARGKISPDAKSPLEYMRGIS
jgi:hypothetical protein